MEQNKQLEKEKNIAYHSTYGNGIHPSAVKELYECLQEAILQIEYLHGKFGETGSGNAVLSKCKTAIQKADINQ